MQVDLILPGGIRPGGVFVFVEPPGLKHVALDPDPLDRVPQHVSHGAAHATGIGRAHSRNRKQRCEHPYQSNKNDRPPHGVPLLPDLLRR